MQFTDVHSSQEALVVSKERKNESNMLKGAFRARFVEANSSGAVVEIGRSPLRRFATNTPACFNLRDGNGGGQCFITYGMATVEAVLHRLCVLDS